METQHGKYSTQLTRPSFATILATYACCQVDFGTGDGRFVRHTARAHPTRLVIGVDACREQLWDASRRALANELYVIANVESLPIELAGVASHVTINFPWGTLLEGLLDPRSPVLERLVGVMRPRATVEVRLNAGALAEAGYALDAGAAQVRRALVEAGYAMAAPVELDAPALRAYPTTWSKRLAFGRDPRAVLLDGRWLASATRGAHSASPWRFASTR